MELPEETDFTPHGTTFKGSLKIEPRERVENPRDFIKAFIDTMKQREEALGNPQPQFRSFGNEPLEESELLKDIGPEAIQESFDLHIKAFKYDNDKLVKQCKKYSSVKIFYSWLEAFAIAEKAILENLLNGNNFLRSPGIDHLEIYFKIGAEELKLDVQRYPNNSLREHRLKLVIKVEPAFWGMVLNYNTIAFSKK